MTARQGHDRPPARILLVDDDPAVRSFTERILRASGYEVVSAGDAQAALARAAEAGHIDVLLSDVVLPRMNGLALARKLESRQPRLGVLLMSGYGDEPLGTSEPLPFELLAKPFSDEQLLARVDAVLEKTRQE